MSDKFKNKYRIKSSRLQNWDYGWNAACFVTICTKNRGLFFGEIVNREMQLFPIGVIPNLLWYETTRKIGKKINLPSKNHKK